MANSGIVWNDAIFNWAVYGLVWLAKLFGITYEEVNVWIFCVAWPLTTIFMAIIIWWQYRQIRDHRIELK
jgi:hypothetical protein